MVSGAPAAAGGGNFGDLGRAPAEIAPRGVDLRVGQSALDRLDRRTGFVCLGRAAGAAVHVVNLVRDTRSARDLAEPCAMAAFSDWQTVLGLHDRPRAKVMWNLLKQWEQQRILL